MTQAAGNASHDEDPRIDALANSALSPMLQAHVEASVNKWLEDRCEAARDSLAPVAMAGDKGVRSKRIAAFAELIRTKGVERAFADRDRVAQYNADVSAERGEQPAHLQHNPETAADKQQQYAELIRARGLKWALANSNLRDEYRSDFN